LTQEGGPTFDVLVIGAGIAGLIAAGELQGAGCRVLVLDKGRRIGGRLASQRIGGATFDHGAQFITARTPRFASLVEDCRRAGVVEAWHRGSGSRPDGHVRWRGHPDMNAVPTYLGRGLAIAPETRVVALRACRDFWSAETATGDLHAARAVVLTPPVPQSLAILEAGAVTVPPEVRARLESLTYERCLAVMAVLGGPSRLAPPGGLAPEGGPIAWIADNRLKGISAESAVTIHGTHAFSLEHWERDRQDSGRRLLDAAGDWLDAEVRTFQVHAWRYSKPLQVDDSPCAVVSRAPPLVLAGDAFAGPKVEGAALAGWAAAEAVLAAGS
jgi:renalase